MSPKVLEVRGLIFWFHSYDARHETRASVHVGKGTQDDTLDAKLWLEPNIEIARQGRTLREHELQLALQIAAQYAEHLRKEWYAYRNRAS